MSVFKCLEKYDFVVSTTEPRLLKNVGNATAHAEVATPGWTAGVDSAGLDSSCGGLALLVWALWGPALCTRLFVPGIKPGIPPQPPASRDSRSHRLLVAEVVLQPQPSGVLCLSPPPPTPFLYRSRGGGGGRTRTESAAQGLQQVSPAAEFLLVAIPAAALPSASQVSALLPCRAYSSWWPPCPIPSSAVCSFTLHEFYSQSINKPIIIGVLYSHHISSSVINHFMRESGSFSISHSSLFLRQWLRDRNWEFKPKNSVFAQ